MHNEVVEFGSNIRSKDTRSVYYLLTFLHEFSLSLISAIYVLFLLKQGLDLFEVMLVNLAFMVGIFIFEIPTGAYADFYGRRRSIILSFIFLLFTFVLYFLSNSLWMFILAEVLAAIAFTFSSGALDAWLVDSFEKQEYTGNVDYIFSNAEVVGKSAAIFGGLLGGYIGSINLALPFGVGAGLIFITLIIAVSFIHERFTPKETPNLASSISRIGKVTRDSITYGLKHKVILWLIFSSIVYSFAFMPLNMYWSPRMNDLAENQIWIVGWIWAGMALFMIGGSYLVKHLLKKEKTYSWIMIATALFLAIPILLASLSNIFAIVLYSFLMYEIGRGMLKPAHKAYLNKFIPGKQRATVLSFDSMMARFGSAIGLVLFGLIANQYGIQTSWMISGFVLLLLVPIYLRVSHHEKRLTAS